jgi:hypothetical protein
MNRRELLALVPALLLAPKYTLLQAEVRQAGSRSQPRMDLNSAVTSFEVIVTFDNKYPGDSQNLTFSLLERKRINDAIDRWKAVWATDQFRKWVLGAKFQMTKGDSDSVIFQKVMAANPKHVNYALTDVKKGSETAITDGDAQITRLQRSWIADNGASTNQLVNTLAHEYTHTREGGEFYHAWLQRVYGKNAVPILIGNITQSIAESMFPTSPSSKSA